ncbi:uncharacterized protein LOC107361548 [Tetranychus urticae]|uniref:Biogenesis of lysosome-related organelles complex 1 subunit 4 n=1 Tax=Tetranychus urticae TaxID=32264 RepID=T1K8I1_TETUR|nr:uncharacterized protein LOC107361548 [Tetranychus urticae]
MDNIETTASDEVTIKNLVKELAEDYSDFFKVDTSEVIKQFDNSIEENLVILEDFCTTLDMIRNNTGRLEQSSLTIATKSKEMEVLYESIDKLELFVNVVKDQVNKMEDELIKAEQSFASRSKVKKFITSLLLPSIKTKSPSTSPEIQPSFGFDEIFRTQDYIANRPNNVPTDSDSIHSSEEKPSTCDIKSEPKG